MGAQNPPFSEIHSVPTVRLRQRGCSRDETGIHQRIPTRQSKRFRTLCSAGDLNKARSDRERLQMVSFVLWILHKGNGEQHSRCPYLVSRILQNNINISGETPNHNSIRKQLGEKQQTICTKAIKLDRIETFQQTKSSDLRSYGRFHRSNYERTNLHADS